MEYKAALKEMVEINKTNVNNSFNTFILFQEQAEKMTDMFKAQTPWIPKESWGFVNGLINFNKKGVEDFRDSVNAGFDSYVEFIEKT